MSSTANLNPPRAVGHPCMKRVVIVVLGLLIGAAGCFGGKRLVYIKSRTGMPTGDIWIKASISDTVFDVRNLENYSTDLDFTSPFGEKYANPYDVDLSEFHGPKVTFTLHNRSSRPYMVPSGGLEVGEYCDLGGSTGIGVCIYHDSVGLALEEVWGVPHCDDEDLSFTLLHPNDSIQFGEPIDALMYFACYLGHVPEGKFSLRISYDSHCAPPGDTSVWIGRAASEVFLFRVK